MPDSADCFGTRSGIYRRNIVVVDDSNHSVVIGIWGDSAEQLQLIAGSSIVAIKHSQVSDYAGKSLNCNPSYNCKFYIDPDMERAKDIVVWFYELDDDSRSEIRSISKGIVLDSNPQTNDFLDQKFMKNPNE